ncbi:MAG TPA: aldehyde dehydrogenase family protein [Steroidobacteraceae bacterium]
MTLPQTRTDWQHAAAALRYQTGHYIDGRHVPGSGPRFTVVNPATAQPLCEVASGQAADVDAAVASARRAHKDGRWRRMAPRDRLDVMNRLAALIERHLADFVLLDSLCMGKPVRDMVNVDVPQSALTFRYFAELSDKVEGTVTATAADAFHYTLREPLGVVGCITPWNYPLMQIAWKIAPALAAGNCVVLKPAEQAPLSALLLAELFVEAGAPAGVFNVVNGYGSDAGAPLALHEDVAKISFTGSTVTGKKMLVYAGQSNMKRVSLECGGKSPQIFLADLEDLDRAVTYAINGIFGVMGEVCSAGSRLLVDKPLMSAFTERFIERGAKAYTAGDPLDPETNMGPLVTKKQHERVIGYIDRGRAEGARLAFGGDAPDLPGYYVNPTLFTGVDNRMVIAQEEIFGPVATLIEVDGLEHALQVANDTIYGLAASVWTSSLNQALLAVRNLEAGTLYVNCFDHGDPTSPFLGHKQSGQGGDKCLEGLLNYTQTKSAWVHLG